MWNIKISFIFPLSLSCDAYTNCILKCRMITIYYRKSIRCKTIWEREISLYFWQPLFGLSLVFFIAIFLYTYISTVITSKPGKDAMSSRLNLASFADSFLNNRRLHSESVFCKIIARWNWTEVQSALIRHYTKFQSYILNLKSPKFFIGIIIQDIAHNERNCSNDTVDGIISFFSTMR